MTAAASNPTTTLPRTSASRPARSPAALAGREVLVDTYNLRLAKGSGIKTYGQTLVEALANLDATVSLLGDRAVPRASSSALSEVLFYDHPRRRSRLGRMLSGMRGGARTVVASTTPSEIEQRLVIPDDAIRRLPRVDHILNAPRLYDAANVAYKRLGKMTTVKPPRRVDLWHATTMLPLRLKRTPTVTTVHDVIPLRLPYTTLDDKKFFFNLLRDSLRRSDLILAVSECTKRDVLMFFPEVPADRIMVTWQAAPFRIHQPDEAMERALLSRHGLSRHQYLLFVGNIEPKKNVKALIEAFDAMAIDMPLVVVGRKAWLWEDQLAILKHLPADQRNRRFRLLSYVPRHDLAALYANAACLVFPSLYEGFGLPPLEAMAHGCPVICSNVSSLPEVCGDAALYVDPYDNESIRARILELLDDSRKREQLVRAGFDRLEHFSAARYADRLAAAYGRIM